MPHEKDRPASDRTYVEPGELSARERLRHLKGTPTMSIPVVTQQQQQQPQTLPLPEQQTEDEA
jgi:hypothetical protein